MTRYLDLHCWRCGGDWTVVLWLGGRCWMAGRMAGKFRAARLV